MRKVVGLWVHMLCASFPLWAQVDTSYIYNSNMPYGRLDIRIAKSETRYYYLQEGVTFSFRESAPGVKTNTYKDMTSWDSSPYGEGNLREKNGTKDYFVMNYRYLIPGNYDPSYKPGYPVIIMFHGLGERGNCWNNDCYWSTPSWNPNTNSPPAPTFVNDELLNNDHSLLHGGLQHLQAVNLAGSKLPDDPTLPSRAFPGFLLFPQNLNGWEHASTVEDAIRILRLFMKKYNIDENRVYIHGLSNGGGAVYQALKRAPWLFAAALPMSAISDGGVINSGLAPEVGKIPIWQFQGAKDLNPTPNKTYNTIRDLREAGAVVRYYLYPNLGHGTWNTAYKEPDFFSWMLSNRKYNPHVFYGNPVICNTTGAGVHIGFSNGFYAYQWEQDGNIIPGQTSSELIANVPGTYRGRFSRKPNPAEADWEPWSDPIVVTEVDPSKARILTEGSTHLRGPGLPSTDSNNTVILRSQEHADLYTWYKNGEAINFPGTDVDDTLRYATITSASTYQNGAYTLVTSHSHCPGPPSDPLNLFFNNSAPENIILDPAAVDFKGKIIGSGVFLTWNDMLSNELAYEVWRRKAGGGDFVFAGRIEKDGISFYDNPLEPETVYEYKFRAVNNSGTSNYLPSDDLDDNYRITTAADQEPPSAPENLKVVSNTIHSITLSWVPSTDNTGIKEYLVQYGTTVVPTGSSATRFTVSGLSSNKEYPITVTAVDLAGHHSSPSNQVIGSTNVIGLFYKHSTGAWEDLDDPTLTATWDAPEYTGWVSNFTLAPRTQEDYFNFQFTGYLDIATPGNYRLSTRSDDGSRLILDDSVLVDNDGTHGNVTVASDTFYLTAGPHPIEVQYFEYAGGQNLVVQYSGPDTGDQFITIPDSVLRSGKSAPSSTPPVPTGLAASATGMEEIQLTWQSPSPGIDVEIYRAESKTDPFIILGRSPSGIFTDSVGLTPGTAYYYKARTVTDNGVSGFTDVVSDTTFKDVAAPSIPDSLRAGNKTNTQVTLSWESSTDNVGVTGYEVYTDNVLTGTTDIPAFTVTDLVPATTYKFTVRAFDASHNKSAFSAGLSVATNPSAIYYAKATGNLNALATWGQNADGTGTSPVSFLENSQYFIIANRTFTNTGGPWTVDGTASKVIVPDGVTLNVDEAFTGKAELEGTATINLNHTTVPDLQKLSATSTVIFNACSFVEKNTYGHIVLTGSGIKTFEADTTSVLGNLTVGDGVTLKGAPANATTLSVSGNISAAAGTGFIAADNRINLLLTENVSHDIFTAKDLYFFQITAGDHSVIHIQHDSAPINITLGSLRGGGLLMNEGSLLNLDDNNLFLAQGATVNGHNEKGRMGINGGSIMITSSSEEDSNLYFDAMNNIADTLAVDLTGTGAVKVYAPLKVKTVLQVYHGALDAGGNITLLSTAEKTASIGEIGADGSIRGEVKVQQYLEPLGESWRELSVPVSSVTVADWQNYFPVTGSFTGASTGSGLTNDPSMFVSDGQVMSAYPPAGGSNQAPLEKAKGYSVKLDHTSPVTLQVSGNPYQGTVTFPLQVQNAGGDTPGWNLVGNPFASPVLWSNDVEAWSRSGVGSVIAVKENKVINGEAVGQYHYYDLLLGEGKIRPGQGFWVHAFSQAPSLAVTEKAKIPGTEEYPSVNNQSHYLIVTLSKGELADPAYILFTAAATEAFDDLYDAFKKKNEGIFNLSTLTADHFDAAVNTLPDSFCSLDVDLDIRNALPGNYVLSFTGTETLAGIGRVTVTDHYTGNTFALSGDPYSFNITDEPETYGSGRFTITFVRNALDLTTPQVTAADLCAEEDAIISISHSQAGVDYVVIDDNGEEISPVAEGGMEMLELVISPDHLKEGLQHIRVKASFKGCASQILTSEAEFTYTPSFSITVQGDVSVCVGGQATLHASGIPEDGHYQWYDENYTTIDAATSDSIVTPPVWMETVFHVSGILDNGCESEMKSIHIYADTLEVPVIYMQNDTLFTQVEADYQWLKDGMVIEGATKPYFVPSASGDYTVVVFASGCSEESAVYTYVADPGCQVDSISPVVTAKNNCGDEFVSINITNSQADVSYTAVNDKDEMISSPGAGTGSTLTLQVAATALDSGMNHVRIRANVAGCPDTFLNSEVTFTYTPIDTPVIIEADSTTLEVNVSGAYQWKKDGTIIVGATGSTYSPTAPGGYTVVVSVGTCSKESAVFMFTRDPGCRLNISMPVATAENNCGEEFEFITIDPSQPDVLYTAVNDEGEMISSIKIGTGSAIALQVPATVLDSGENHLRIRADMKGCTAAFLDSEVTFTYTPITIPVITETENGLSANGAGTFQWKKDGVIIDGATGIDYSPSASGLYTVVISAGSCSKESSPLKFFVTGTAAGHSNEFVLNTFPVPATGSGFRVSIEAPGIEDILVTIIDLAGREVFSQRYSPGQIKTGIPIVPDSGPLSDGMYIVIARQADFEIRRRVVVMN